MTFVNLYQLQPSGNAVTSSQKTRALEGPCHYFPTL